MTGHFKNILCPVELEEYSLSALDTARALALMDPARETTIYLLHLLPVQVSRGDPSPTYTVDDYRMEEARSSLDQAVCKRLQYVNYRVLIERAAHWSRSNAVIATAAKIAADLIVMATRGGTGLSWLIRGSVAEEVVRRAACPVLTVVPRVLTSPVGPRHNVLHFP